MPTFRNNTRRYAYAVACMSALAATVLPGAPATAAGNTTSLAGSYVSLGDSFTAGPLIPNQVAESGICMRSDHNYPTLLAEAGGASAFTDVSCSGAITDDMAGRQWFLIAPQFDALGQDTSLVTVGIGGNDVDFVGITITCVALAAQDSVGSPCKDNFTRGGVDQLAARVDQTAPKIAAVLRGVRQHAPGAHVVLLGYPALLPDDKGKCATDLPFAAGDVPYLLSVEQKLNQMLAEQAAAASVNYVDLYASSVGHDACQAPGTRWVEGLLDAQNAFPFHPNALGMRNAARQIQATLGSTP